MNESYAKAVGDCETGIISRRDALAARLSFFNNKCACGMQKKLCLIGDPNLCAHREAGNLDRDRECKEYLAKLAAEAS